MEKLLGLKELINVLEISTAYLVSEHPFRSLCFEGEKLNIFF